MSRLRHIAISLTATFVALGITFTLGACAGQGASSGKDADSAPASQVPADPLEGISADSRVVALSHTAADLWLGAGGQLAAVTDDALDVTGLPADTQSLGNLATLDGSVLVDAQPDLLIIADNRQLSAAQQTAVTGAGIPVLSLSVASLDDYDQALALLTGATGRDDLYEANVTNQRARIEDVVEHSYQENRGSFVLLRMASDGKLSAAGNDDFASSMLIELGLTNAREQGGTITTQDLAGMNPDWLFVAYGSSATEGQEYFASLQSDPAWQELEAVRAGKVVTLPPALFSYPPNARWLEAYSYLSQHLHGSLA